MEDSDLTSQGEQPKLVDFPDVADWRIWHVMVAIASVCVAGFLLAYLVAKTSSGVSDSLGGLFTLFFLLVLMAAGFIWLAYDGNSRPEVIVEKHADGDIRGLLQEYFAAPQWRFRTNIQNLTRVLADSGRRDETIRIFRKHQPPAVAPFVHPFEPIPLDECTPLLASLEEATSISITGNSTEGTKLRRAVRLAGGWVALAFPAMMTGYALVKAYRLGRVELLTVIWLFYFPVMILALSYRGAWSSRRQLLLVPGGLVSRTTRSIRRDWDLHLFERCSSVLIIDDQRDLRWELCVADRESRHLAMLTEREALMLLRAWLSPLPPPPVERLSDLA